MSERTGPDSIPEWDLADRMRKSMRTADIGVQEMADYLGVARNTVSTWINGRITPGRQTLILWALRCGVSYEWLADAESTPEVRVRSRCTAPAHRRLRLIPGQVADGSTRMPLHATASSVSIPRSPDLVILSGRLPQTSRRVSA